MASDSGNHGRPRSKHTVRLLAGMAALAIGVLLVVWSGPLLAKYRFWRSFQSLGTNEQGLREYLHRRTGIVLVRMPAGSFLSDGRSVTVAPFLIARHEVSQAEWEGVVGTVPCRFSGDDLPVDSISWSDCLAFCERTGLVPPSEEQWEYACRAGTETRFTFGKILSTDDANFRCGRPNTALSRLTDQMIKRRSGLEPESLLAELYGEEGETPWPARTNVIDSYRPNGFGLHNMHGNVAEWCRPYDGRDSSYGVRRGGSWRDEAYRCASRDRTLWVTSEGTTGFRPAYSPLP